MPGEHQRDIVGGAHVLELEAELDEGVQLGAAAAQCPLVDRREHGGTHREQQQANGVEGGVAEAAGGAIAEQTGRGRGVSEEEQQRVPNRELQPGAVRHDECHRGDVEEHERPHPAVGTTGEHEGEREEHPVQQQHPRHRRMDEPRSAAPNDLDSGREHQVGGDQRHHLAGIAVEEPDGGDGGGEEHPQPLDDGQTVRQPNVLAGAPDGVHRKRRKSPGRSPSFGSRRSTRPWTARNTSTAAISRSRAVNDRSATVLGDSARRSPPASWAAGGGAASTCAGAGASGTGAAAGDAAPTGAAVGDEAGTTAPAGGASGGADDSSTSANGAGDSSTSADGAGDGASGADGVAGATGAASGAVGAMTGAVSPTTGAASAAGASVSPFADGAAAALRCAPRAQGRQSRSPAARRARHRRRRGRVGPGPASRGRRRRGRCGGRHRRDRPTGRPSGRRRSRARPSRGARRPQCSARRLPTPFSRERWVVERRRQDRYARDPRRDYRLTGVRNLSPSRR